MVDKEDEVGEREKYGWSTNLKCGVFLTFHHRRRGASLKHGVHYAKAMHAFGFPSSMNFMQPNFVWARNLHVGLKYGLQIKLYMILRNHEMLPCFLSVFSFFLGIVMEEH